MSDAATSAGAWAAAWALLLATSAAAADKPLFAPPAAWVTPAPIPRITPSTDGSALQIVLADSEARVGDDADEIYTETAIRVLTADGLAAMSSVVRAWNPDTETMTFHRIAIVRGDQTIDLLAGGKSLTVLRRETDLERAMLNGELTAAMQPEGLRVGDILDVATTLTRHDPVLAGRSEWTSAVSLPGITGRVRLRAIWPDAKPIRWRATEGLPAPVLTKANGASQLVVDATNFTAPKPPLGAPSRYLDVGQLEVSQFKSWSEVAALMAPLYAKAAVLASDSPLRAEVEKIRRTSNDPKARTEAALRLAEEQVHYVFLGLNFGGYKPVAADLTWSRRFGDCKGKTALLLALLHELGVEAEPVMASTGLGDGLDEKLPRLGAFDHVLVRARIGQKIYWLDATRVGDRDLDDIPLPDYHWVLPMRPAGAQLEKVEARPFETPTFEIVERFDASAGLDALAAAHVEQIVRGDAAIVLHAGLASAGRADAERTLREQWRQQIPWVEPKTVDYAYEDARHVLRLTMDGEAKMDWAHNSDVREFPVPDSTLGFNATFAREPGPYSDAPFAVAYPVFNRWTVQIRLPAKGAGFVLGGGAAPDIDKVIAGHRYVRHARIEGGVVTMVAEEVSEAREFPASEAKTAAADLRAMARYNLVVRSPPDFSAAAMEPAAPASTADEDEGALPTTAAGLGQRGVRDLGRHEYDRAIDDFTRAARLEPAVAKHLYDRGVAYFQKGDESHALADFTAALRLAPGDLLALMARGDLEFARGDRARAEEDYAMAVRLAPDPQGALERRSAAHERAGLFEAAVRDYDSLIDRASDASRRAAWLNARCWARAEWGQELDGALADCDQALALLPASPDILDSRGFVQLRLGRYKTAVDDYDAALRLGPRRANSLFGRGLAQLSEGRLAEGRADLAAARALAPGVDADFARYGVRAPDARAP